MRKGLVLFAVMALSMISGVAGAAERLEKIVASGVGVDLDRARQNACRNAVEQALSDLLPLDVIVEKNEILKNEVLRYSTTYVSDSRLLSHERNDDGLYAVKVEAKIATLPLKRKLEGLYLPVRPRDGGMGETEANGKEENALKEIEQVVTSYPQGAYSFYVGKPEIEASQAATGRSRAQIPVTIKWDEQYLARVQHLLGKTAVKELSGVEMASLREGADQRLVKDYKLICISEKHPNRNGKADRCFAFHKEDCRSSDVTLSAIRTSPWPASLLALLGSKKIVTVSLHFKEKTGKLVESINYEFISKDDKGRRQEPVRKPADAELILKSGSFDPPNILWRDADTDVLHLLKEEVFNLNANVDMDSTSIKEISSIEVSMTNVAGKE